jgi:hypothetical protein
VTGDTRRNGGKVSMLVGDFLQIPGVGNEESIASLMLHPSPVGSDPRSPMNVTKLVLNNARVYIIEGSQRQKGDPEFAANLEQFRNEKVRSFYLFILD